MKYEDIKYILQRKLQRRQGVVSEEEIEECVADYRHECMSNQAISPEMMDSETAKLNAYLKKRIVPTFGHVSLTRPDGINRLLCANVNGLATASVRNYKVEQIKSISREYNVNGLVFVEHGLNMSNFKPSQTLQKLLELEGTSRAIWSHNKHDKSKTLALQGGCSIVMLNEICQYVKKTKGANDWRDLGRWTSIVLQATTSLRTRIVCAYNVGKTKPTGLKTVYQQLLRYIQNNNLDTNPRALMRNDLIAQLRIWLQSGERIFLFMDANENVIDGQLCSQLSTLGFSPWAHKLHGTVPNTHVEGSECIEEFWGSHGLEVTGVKLLSFHEGIGDHRPFIVDFTSRSAIGLFLHRIIRPDCRRLIMAHAASVATYRRIVEDQFKRHRILERLEAVEAHTCSFPAPPEVEIALERLDRQVIEIQKGAESKCRRIFKIDGEYSLVAKYWHQRIQVLTALIRRADGKATANDGNICRMARNRGISQPRRQSKPELIQFRKAAKARKKTLKTQGKWLRREHLRECFARAKARGNEEKCSQIRQRMLRENCTSMWRSINFTTRDPHPGPLQRVEILQNGTIIEKTTESEMIETIFDETEDRFSAAGIAPISNCSISESLGSFGFTQLGEDITSGNFSPPPDLDDTTAALLEEIGKLGKQFRDNYVDITISPDEFSNIWSKAREKTSSSMCGVHFAHYITAAGSKFLSTVFAKKISLIARTGSAPLRWRNVLMVMLEKKMGCALVGKLRAILLKEADDNFHSGVIFGGRMMDRAREIGFIPEEQMAERHRTAEDGAFQKVLMHDYARLKRSAYSVVSADAANCYDRVNHIILALLLWSLGLPQGPLAAMLVTIAFMKYYLRTGFGESKDYMGGDKSRQRMHGLNQGNRAASHCWSIVSALLVRIQRYRGHVAEIKSPISRLVSTIMGLLYVDDTDLFVLNPDIITIDCLWNRTQVGLTSWGKLLHSTGGGAKPDKSWGYLLAFDWDDTGDWSYVDASKLGYTLEVPTENGMEEIDVLPPSTAKETLGVFTAPDGNSTAQLTKWSNRVKTWVERISSGRLPASFAWVSYTYQLWMSLRYGLGTIPVDIEEVADFLQDQNYSMLSFLGVNKKIRKGWRTIHRAFLGIGLFDFVTELFISRLNMLLQHFDSPHSIGTTLRACLELIQLESGFLDCPLLHSFHPIGHQLTPCWVRSLWQMLDYFNFQLHLAYPTLDIPRDGDIALIAIYLRLRPHAKDFISWNRVRLFLRAIFLSDITTADGKYIDPLYLHGPVDEYRPMSSYDFPEERPSHYDWNVWTSFWSEYTLENDTLPRPLGRWLAPSHRQHEWFYQADADILLHRVEGGARVFGRRSTGLRTRSEHQYELFGPAPVTPDLLEYKPCSVRRITSEVVYLGATGPDHVPSTPITHDFLSYLKSWGGNWMWDGIVLRGSFQHVLSAVKESRACWVTDGSYDRKRAPSISSAGWIIFCPQTKSYVRGAFYEVSPDSSAFRGELLGLTALHLFALALKLHYGIETNMGSVHCDNERALGRASLYRRRIPPGAKHGDLLRSLRNTKNILQNVFTYRHIYGHADRTKRWDQMTLIEQLNCLCDTWAKGARYEGTVSPRDATSQVLPRERAAVFIHGVKQTGDLAEVARFELGLIEARRFYINELGWHEDAFDRVDWLSLDFALSKKSKMYQVWIAKQASSFCGSRLMTSRMFNNSDTCCPSCLRPDERASHLNLCLCPERTKQFKESVATLQAWLDKRHTHPDIAFWVPRYLFGRNRIQFQALPFYAPPYLRMRLSPQMQRLAEEQDSIGWTHFLEGKISKQFYHIQQAYLAGSPSPLNGRDWVKSFISELLQISHTQWLFRNITLHDKRQGHLATTRKKELLAEIEKLHKTPIDDIPPESKFLLDCDLDDLKAADNDHQEQWIDAILAARKAGLRLRRLNIRLHRQSRHRRQRLHSQPLPPSSFERVTTQQPVSYTVFADLLEVPPRTRPSEAFFEAQLASNKRRKRRRKNAD